MRLAASDGLQSRCRDCSKRWYQANREGRLKAVAARNASQRREVNARLAEYLLQHLCVDCGETDVRVLDFDHRPDEVKLSEVTTLIQLRRRWSAISAEILKCDVRCANCHRKRTLDGGSSWRALAVRAMSPPDGNALLVSESRAQELAP